MSKERPDGRGHPPRTSQTPARPRTTLPPSLRRRTGDPARSAAYDVLREVSGSHAYSNLVLPPMLRHRGITGRDAAFATELTYGALRMQRRYDLIISEAAGRAPADIDAPVLDLLRLGAHQLLAMRVPDHAAVSETVGLARARLGAGPAKFVNAVLRQVAQVPLTEWLERLGAAQPDPVERLAAVQSHPGWVARALGQALAAEGRESELELLLVADNAAPAVTLVARPGLVSRADLQAAVPGSVPGRWTPTAVVVDRGDPAGVAAVRQGLAGVQDEGSQLVTLALLEVDVGPDLRWLDLTAGPGGKTALLGAVASQRGAQVVAIEVQPHRALLVERAVAALPPGVVQVRCGDGRDLGRAEPGSYDRVLVDAPCTGLGALRRRPEARWRRAPGDLPALSKLQRELLGSALDAVRPGGVVAYVTCSPHVAETTFLVRDVLKARDDVVQLDARQAVRAVAGTAIPLGAGPAVQLWPHVHGTDAMYLALLRRLGAGESSPPHLPDPSD